MRSPNKQRIFNAINHIETEEIPILEIDPDMAIVNKILNKDLPFNLHPFELEAEDNIELNLRMGNDIVFFGHVWRVGRKEFADEDGRLHYADGLIKNREQMKTDIWFPELDKLERRLEDHCKKIEGTGMGLMVKAQLPSFTIMCAIGYADFLINTVTDHHFLMDFTKLIHEYCMKELELFLKYPVDIVQVSSGMVYNTGPMVSPEELEILEMQFVREEINLALSKDKKIYFHIDGKIGDMIPEFIKMGVDILNPIDLCGGQQDIYDIKKKYGDKLTLSGNIDIEGVLKNGTPEEVKADVEEHIEKLAPGGGYIISSSHNLHELVPIENFYAMRDAVLNYKSKVE